MGSDRGDTTRRPDRLAVRSAEAIAKREAYVNEGDGEGLGVREREAISLGHLPMSMPMIIAVLSANGHGQLIFMLIRRWSLSEFWNFGNATLRFVSFWLYETGNAAMRQLEIQLEMEMKNTMPPPMDHMDL